MTGTKKKMILCALLLIAMLAFIWGNSLRTGTESGATSGMLMEWINQFLHLDEQTANTLHLVIRKIAHFTEFACLGLLLARWFGMTGEKNGHLFYMPLLFGLLAACVDETIQVFVLDRTPSLIDVWIDTGGIVSGISAVLIRNHYIRKKQTDKNLEETT